MRFTIKFIATTLFVLIVGNGLYVSYPAIHALQKDSRNESVHIVAYLWAGIDPRTLVIDIWSLERGASMADVDRSFLDIASALKGRLFSRVYLSYRGSSRFMISGNYFQKLGQEREWQNPVFTMRTMAENMLTMDGTNAFNSWTGGLIGVVGKQMEDHNRLHEAWYIDDFYN
jgi:hypothetical protein